MKDNRLLLSGLAVGYRKRAILSDLCLSVGAGELIALIGRNGTGKSTLLRTIARWQPKLSGEMLLSGQAVEKFAKDQWAEKMSMVSTEAVHVSHLTVRRLVAFGRFPHTNWIGTLTAEDKAKVEEAMQQVGITRLAEKNLHEISDGERQRAMIARTLAQDTDMILLDEPTAYLDMPNQYELVRLLHRLTREKGKSILFSTHDLHIAMQEADKLWMIDHCRVYEGAPEDLALSGQLNRIFESEQFHFDDASGRFSVRRNATASVVLAGEGAPVFWTQKALERMGFSVKLCPVPCDAPFSVTVTAGRPAEWLLSRNGAVARFKSILELCRHMGYTDHPQTRRGQDIPL
jgi:iron complex transport system ATP-binding protein